MNRTASTNEVRNSYKNAGHAVRISRNGHVEFKRNGEGSWLEGRWVSEYRIHRQRGITLT